MTGDGYTKIVLTLIAIALCLSTAQGLGWVGGADEAGGRDVPRFRIVPVSQTRLVFKLDTETGDTWYGDMRGMKSWTPLHEATAEEIAEWAEQAEAAAAAQVQRRGAKPRPKRAPAPAPNAPEPAAE